MFPPIVLALAFVVSGEANEDAVSLSPETTTYSTTYTLEVKQEEQSTRPLNNAEKVILKGLPDAKLMELIEKNIEEHQDIWTALATS